MIGKVIKAALLLGLIAYATKAQVWTPFPYHFSWAVNKLYSDSADGNLYIGGPFNRVDGDTVYAILGWNGTDTVHLGLGLRQAASPDGAYVSNIIGYHGKLFVTGGFDQAPPQSDSLITLAQWNGAHWDSVANPHPFGYGCGGLSLVGDTLFISGTFNGLSQHPCGGVAAYYNGHVVQCFGGFPDAQSHYVSGVIRYHGDLFAYGHILDSVNGQGQLAFGRWNPTSQTWDRVANAFAGDHNSSVFSAAVFNDELYVCGDFPQSQNVAGNFIMKWNGSQWAPVGGLDGSANYIKAHGGLLYVAGEFHHAGSTLSESIAAFDGSGWYALNDQYFEGPINTFAFYQDELYVGGNFHVIGTDSISYLARYNLPLSALEQKARDNASFNLYPNPATDNATLSLNWQSETKADVQMLNVLGQLVFSQTLALHPGLNQSTLALSNLPTGCYMVKLKAGNRVLTKKLLKQ